MIAPILRDLPSRAHIIEHSYNINTIQ